MYIIILKIKTIDNCAFKHVKYNSQSNSQKKSNVFKQYKLSRLVLMRLFKKVKTANLKLFV